MKFNQISNYMLLLISLVGVLGPLRRDIVSLVVVGYVHWVSSHEFTMVVVFTDRANMLTKHAKREARDRRTITAIQARGGPILTYSWRSTRFFRNHSTFTIKARR